MKIYSRLEIPQQTEQWFKIRAGRPTASIAKSIMTPTGRKSKGWENLFYDLVASSLNPYEVKFEGNIHTDRGNELEPIARQTFADLSGLDVQEVGFVIGDDECCGCSPDALIYRDGKPIAGLEIKCPVLKTQIKHKFGPSIVPDDYPPQVHFSMAVTKLRYWFFMSYAEGVQPYIHLQEWDETTDKMSEYLSEFVAEYKQRYNEIMAKIKEPVNLQPLIEKLK